MVQNLIFAKENSIWITGDFTEKISADSKSSTWQRRRFINKKIAVFSIVGKICSFIVNLAKSKFLNS